jgi:hypothetical protein
MFSFFNKRLLYFFCFFIAAGLLASCDKDDDVTSGGVQLLSFGPTGAMHGDTLWFIGNNLDQVTSIRFTGDSVAKAGFTEQTREKIAVIVPQGAEKGFVTLKTPTGDIMSKSQLDLEVVVAVSAIPASARPGDNITIAGNYMNWVTQVWFEKDKLVDTFVSKSLTELVVKVPMDAQSGKLRIVYGGTEPEEITTDSSLNVVLPSITGINPNPIEREANLTITGQNLDLVKGMMFKGKTSADTVFVSRSATELVVKVPKEANKGKISLVAYSGLMVESAQSLLFVGDLPDLAPLSYAFYIDKLENSWQNWGWGSTATFNSADNVRDGAASIKMQYTGEWGALKFANANVSTANYNELTFSIFGTPGTAGKKINLTPSGGSTYTITLEEGKWVEYKLTKAQLGNPAEIKDLTFQNQAWTGTVYIDHVGLR